MKLHIVSNAPWGNTGYSNQTRIFLPRLLGLGHEVTATAFWGLEGAPLNWRGIKVFPKGHHPYGQDIMSANATRAGADLMISLMDAWVCDPSLYGQMRWAPWFPVDSEPLPFAVKHKVEQAFARIVYSKFGEQMTREAGLDCFYVPHGVESKVFKPLQTPKDELLEKLGWPKDRYVVGMVAANKGNPSRKAFVENIAAFAELKKKHDDAWLYLHTARCENGEYGGVNLPEYLHGLGLKEGRDFGFPNQYNLLVSYPDDYMVAAYNAMDVHLLVSMGEGFGIPILEAQACGTPVIVGDWTAMGELCFEGWKLPKDRAHKFWTPLAAYQYAPDPNAIAEMLLDAYEKSADMGAKAREGALAYDADLVTKDYWKPALTEIEAQIEFTKKERKWAKVGVNLGDGALHIPSLDKDDPADMRVYGDGRKLVHPKGFEMEHNGVTLDIEDDPEGGVSKVVMKEIANVYDLDLDYKDGDVIVDIGAHVGIVSCYLGKKYPQVKIHAFEPNPHNFERLERNLKANEVENVTAWWEAVTGDGRDVRIGNNLAENSGGNGIYGDEGDFVGSMRLDRILENRNLDRIRLLKLDCEGAEYEIIEANPDLLLRVDAVRGELHPMPGKDMQKFLELIKSYVPDTKMVMLGGAQ